MPPSFVDLSPAGDAPGLPPEAVATLLSRVRAAFGVDFSAYKPKTIERRIEARMRRLQLADAEAYLRHLDATAGEVRALYDDLLIGVTGFFRDQAPFTALVTTALPALLAERTPGLPLRVWVPACATGEEAYSVAICVLEALGPDAAGTPVQVFATDLDEAALQHARQGLYPADIELDVSAERLARFFTREAGGWRVAPDVRSRLVFARHDLANDPPFSRLDVVSCRNVLIYLQPALQRRVLRVLQYALRPGGLLLIGTSESVADAGFAAIDARNKLYRKAGPAPLPAVLPGPRWQPVAPGPSGARPSVDASSVADRLVLERYGPPGVLVNLGFEVLQFRGRTGAFLDPHPGSPSFHLFKLIRPELLVPVRSAVLQAAGEWAPVRTAPLGLSDGAVRVDVVPVEHPEPAQRALLVLFVPVEGAAAPVAPASDASAARLEQVERELVGTRAYLEATVQDLQIANEELQSTNEELQTANEEIETSREELRGMNDELLGANAELHARVASQQGGEAALGQLLAWLSVPVVLFDEQRRVRCWSVAAGNLLGLGPADVGAPAQRLTPVLGVALDPLLRTGGALRSGAVHGGAAYALRVSASTGGALLELTAGAP